MGESKRAVDLEGKPYFVWEKANGIFCVISQIVREEQGRWAYNSNGESPLIIESDIREIPTHGLALKVEHPTSECQGLYVVNELRKFSRIAWYDYVSAQLLAPNVITQPLATYGNMNIVAVYPRVFRKINEE